MGTVLMEPPHSEKQREMIEFPGFGVALCGRRFGKTTSGRQRILRFAAVDPGLYWWVGLSWKSASMKRAWRELQYYSAAAIRAAGMDPDKHINRSDFEIRFPNGSEIWLRTAERPESLAGEGIKGAVVDEFTLMPEVVWTEYLQATLLDYNGWAFFMGVPKGRNWASNLYLSSSSWPGWKTWQATTYDNPNISQILIDDIKRTTPERIFRQEYMAEIIDDAGGVFRNVMKAAVATRQSAPILGHVYVMGVDLARLSDYTVLTIIDVTMMELVWLDRFSKVSFEMQETRIQAASNLFSPISIGMENVGMGAQMVERLASKGLRIVPFVTGNKTKDAIISGLSVAIEQGELTIIPDEVLINELQAYEMKQSAAGNWIYAAPSGAFDDCVMSLALCYNQIGKEKSVPIVSPLSLGKQSAWLDRSSPVRDWYGDGEGDDNMSIRMIPLSTDDSALWALERTLRGLSPTAGLRRNGLTGEWDVDDGGRISVECDPGVEGYLRYAVVRQGYVKSVE